MHNDCCYRTAIRTMSTWPRRRCTFGERFRWTAMCTRCVRPDLRRNAAIWSRMRRTNCRTELSSTSVVPLYSGGLVRDWQEAPVDWISNVDWTNSTPESLKWVNCSKISLAVSGQFEYPHRSKEKITEKQQFVSTTLRLSLVWTCSGECERSRESILGLHGIVF